MATDRTVRVVQTCVVLFVMTNVGVNIGLFSPTLPDIEQMTSSSTSQVSMTLMGAGVSSVAGTLLIGPLFDRLDGFLLLTVCMAVQAVAIGLAPLWSSLLVYQALAAIAFVVNFALMSGCMSINCALWKLKPTYLVPIIQVTDLMHAVGTAITPQVVRPFIGHHPITATNTSAPTADVNVPTSPTGSGRLLPVQLAYLMIGAFDVATAVLCLSVFCWRRGRCARRLRTNEHDDGDEKPFLERGADGAEEEKASSTLLHGKVTPKSRRGVVLLGVMSLFFVVNGGRDVLLTGLLFTYVNTLVGWSVGAGTTLVTVYHLTRVVIHALLVPVSRWVSPAKLTAVNLAVLMVGALLATGSLVVSVGAQRALLAAGVVVTGVATSNVHPTAITLVEEVVHVGAPIMALLISSVGAGQIVFAPLAGWMLENSGIISYPLTLVGLAALGLGLFGLWLVLRRRFVAAANEGHRADSTSAHSASSKDVSSSVTSPFGAGRRRHVSANSYLVNEGGRDLGDPDYDDDDDDDDDDDTIFVSSKLRNKSKFFVVNDDIDDEF